MHTGALTTLEFDRVVDAVTSFALTPLGAEKLARLRPLTDPHSVHTALAHTTEAVRYLDANGVFPLEAPDDLDAILSALAIEAQPLEPAQLLKLANFLGSVERVCKSVATASGGPFPALSAIVDGCATWGRECGDVRKKVNPAGEVVDDASPVLKTIRSRVRKQRNRLRGTLESYLRGRHTARYLQEQVVTERNGRFVLIVRSEHRTAIPGIVHGSSASGASLFLEPLSTVDINNEIVALDAQERDEVRRVLLALSTAFRRRAVDLHRTLTVATETDVLQARAGFANAVGGVEPRVATDQTLELRDARHPLLMASVTSRLGTQPRQDPPVEPVPVDIVMSPPTRALIISGPNTGGKTVALKTAGLLTLMAQAGLHIPVAPGSRVPVFRSVFADIGDEQSIAANLSTFSGHMTNIVEMDQRLSLPALILLDEVGAGTDPVDGGALGRAIVEHFRRRGAHVIATTHDDALKAYGATAEGVTCAAFGFDPETFAPTYRLVYGSAGRSLALEIASRLGLDPQIIKTATELRSAREAQLADHLAQVDEDRRQLDALRGTLDQQQTELAKRATRLSDRETELERRERAGRKDLEQSLDTRLRAARDEIDAVVDTLRQRAATLERQAAERAVTREPALSTGESGALGRQARAALEAIASGVPTPATPPSSSTRGPAPQIGVGTRVRMSTLGVEGTVRSVHGREAEVEAHGKRVRVPLASLEVVAPHGASTEPQSRVSIQVEAPRGPLDELNLIGCRVDEALSRAEKHLDQALMGEQRVVRFIHGHGTGQLRRAIAGFLDAHPLVQRVSPAAPEEGGSGVTIAELKE
ncbi:MAG: endonuclease MutS2 [Acidobacteria bacterium]|nr:endonuclease MutS2 [Acidobacteriota bacterium]